MKKLFNLITLLLLTSLFTVAQTKSQSFSLSDKTAKDNLLIKCVGLINALIKKNNPNTIKIILCVMHKGQGSRLNFF